LHDDCGDATVVQRLNPIFATLAPGIGNIARTPGREKLGGTSEQGISIVERAVPDISSRWFTTASNTA